MGTLSITRLTPAIGALIGGVDTAEATELEMHGAELREALREHQVIFFRDQHLDPAAQVRLASVFGSVNDVSSTFAHHPDNAQVELLESKGRGPGTDVWHADLTWQRTPPFGACLYAVDVPAAGGDTMWASMTAAYDSLAPKMQAYVNELTALHSWEGPEVIGSVLARPDGEERYRRMRETYPPLEVPVVALHPETKKPVLTVNALYTTSICGVTREESAALITLLAGLARVPEWQVRFHWTPGAVAIWDNRAVQHYAVNDYYPSYRLMHRVTIGAPS
jgi:taurine dioxygenase